MEAGNIGGRRRSRSTRRRVPRYWSRRVVPSSTIVPPRYVFVPLSVSVPVPTLVRLPPLLLSLSMPANVVLPLFADGQGHVRAGWRRSATGCRSLASRRRRNRRCRRKFSAPAARSCRTCCPKAQLESPSMQRAVGNQRRARVAVGDAQGQCARNRHYQAAGAGKRASRGQGSCRWCRIHRCSPAVASVIGTLV